MLIAPADKPGSCNTGFSLCHKCGNEQGVCTRHPGYRKEHNKLMPLLRLKFREYPELVKLLDERHIQYNRMLDKIAYLEKEGRIHVIRPDRDISAKPVERDPAHLKEIYEVGRRVMKADMEKLKAYLAE